MRQTITGITQVIVIREDLNMKKGKMIEQSSNASLQSYIKYKDTSFCKDWVETGKTKKIIAGVNSEEELFEIYRLAHEENLPCILIKDSDFNEFKKSTHTVTVLGPAPEKLINKITGGLNLL